MTQAPDPEDQNDDGGRRDPPASEPVPDATPDPPAPDMSEDNSEPEPDRSDGGRRGSRYERYQIAVALMSNVLAIIALVLVLQQNSLATASLQASTATNEMQFNLQVMERLDDVLLIIADDPNCFAYVWGVEAVVPPVANSKPVQCGDSLIDVMSMALKGVDRIPCFSQNGQDWHLYTHYLLTNSPNVRKRIVENEKWWPELTPYAREPESAKDAADKSVEKCSKTSPNARSSH